MSNWPNLFIAGAPKAGTTSLHQYLDQFPDIYMSPVKEPNFFSRELIREDSYVRPIRDEARYLKLFQGSESYKYRGESSPTYLLDRTAPALMKEKSPNARIIISLRDPVNLAHSFHHMMVARHHTSMSFSEAAAVRVNGEPADWNRRQLRLEYGLYADSLERYIDIFGLDNIFVVIFEEMTRDIGQQLGQIADWLDCTAPKLDGLETQFNRASVARSSIAVKLLLNRRLTQMAENIVPSKVRHFVKERLLMKPMEKPEMEEEAQALLREYYRDDVARVRQLLQRPLPWSNFPEQPAV